MTFFSHVLWENSPKIFGSNLLNYLDFVCPYLNSMSTTKKNTKKKKVKKIICSNHAKLVWYFAPVLRQYLSPIFLLFAI